MRQGRAVAYATGALAGLSAFAAGLTLFTPAHPAALAAAGAGRVHLAVFAAGAAAGVAARRWGAVRVVVLATGVWAAAALDGVLAASTALSSGEGVRVVAVNLYGKNPDLEAAARAVSELDPDVVVSSETTEEAAAELSAALPGLVPVASGAEDGEDIVVWTRLEVTRRGVVDLGGRALPVVTLQGPHGEMTVVGVHLTSPRTTETAAAWRGEHQVLTRWAGWGGATVLAGDFNSSLRHHPMREIAPGGVPARSALSAVQGWQGVLWPQASWPTRGGTGGGVWQWPVLDLDHILVSSATVSDAGTAKVPGSDHLAVWAEVRPGNS